MEVPKRLLGPNGLAFLVRAKMRGAVIMPLATLIARTDGRFLAEFHFERPVGPERQTSVLAQLGVRREGDVE
jgi:hypothetical protein